MTKGGTALQTSTLAIGGANHEVVIPETAAKRRLSGTHSEHRLARVRMLTRVLHRRNASPFRHGFPTLSARSSLTRSRMTNCVWGLPLLFGLGELPARQLRIAADFGRFAAWQPTSSAHLQRRRLAAGQPASSAPTLAACRPGKQQARHSRPRERALASGECRESMPEHR